VKLITEFARQGRAAVSLSGGLNVKDEAKAVRRSVISVTTLA
jgi:hypothetical protein